MPLVLIVMNVAYTATSYPAGVAADQRNQKILLIMGLENCKYGNSISLLSKVEDLLLFAADLYHLMIIIKFSS